MKHTNNSIAVPHILPTPGNQQNLEHRVSFDSYSVIYSNPINVDITRYSSAGCIQIQLFSGNKFVGIIYFYESSEIAGGWYLNPDGIIAIEYPLNRFEDIMLLLKNFNQLDLLYVNSNEQGNPLPHPVGAIMTGKKMIGT